MQPAGPASNKNSDLHRRVFYCPEESAFYAACIRFFLFRPWMPTNIIEFGAGDGSPVIEALCSGYFQGRIEGFEVNADAATQAEKNIYPSGKQGIYQVQNSCFFESFQSPGMEEQCLMANPPYIPARDPGRLLLPNLWGGPDGAGIICRLLEIRFRYALLLIPGISNPLRVIDHALRQGYRVQNYLTTPLPFGRYTSQESVQKHLHAMRRKKEAFFHETHYLLSGVLFCRETPCMDGLEESLLKILAPGDGHVAGRSNTTKIVRDRDFESLGLQKGACK